MSFIKNIFRQSQTEDESLRLIFDERKHLEIELNRSCEDIRRRLADIDLQLFSLRENGANDHAVSTVLQEEQRLWLTVRRLQASLRSTADLEREYKEWVVLAEKGARSEERGARAKLRAEIVASELRLRGVDIDSLSPASTCEGDGEDAEIGARSEERGASLNSEAFLAPRSSLLAPIVWEQGSAEDLLGEIDRAKSDLRRVEQSASADERDAYEIIRGLRHHHAALRLMDREEGRRRVRI